MPYEQKQPAHLPGLGECSVRASQRAHHVGLVVRLIKQWESRGVVEEIYQIVMVSNICNQHLM